MSEERGSSFIFWVIGGIVVLTIASIAATIWISVSNDVPGGYIPPEDRVDAGPP